MSIQIFETYAITNGFRYDIPTRWLDRTVSTGKIGRLLVTDPDADPYWSEDTNLPYIFHSFSSVRKFIDDCGLENPRVFATDSIRTPDGWQHLPVAEIDIADVRRLAGGASVSIFNVKRLVTQEAEYAISFASSDASALKFAYRF